MEELLLRHSFLPQRGVHPLLRRLWHQAVCSRWTALLRPARQLRRTVELASSPHPSLCHYILVQNQSLHPSSSSSPLTLLSLVSLLLIELSLCFAHTWTQEHDLALTVSLLWILLLCMFVSTTTLSPSPPIISLLLPPRLLSFVLYENVQTINS